MVRAANRAVRYLRDHWISAFADEGTEEFGVRGGSNHDRTSATPW